ncbi:MAG TPA: YgiT-type zinc finger protein [Candidatus Hydrogenedentes bacterium]|nr:YgiT-type zinc finger protein [Candidatus Hydrogenedentota bacterium]
MKCLICHSEDIQREAVREVFEQGDDVIRLSIEVPVCRCCGERYYDRETMRKIERFRERLQGQSLPLKEIGKVLVGRE